MEKIKHVFGNPLHVAIPLTKRTRTLVDGEETDVVSDFFPNPDFPVNIILTGFYQKFPYEATMDGNVALFDDSGILPVDTYQVEVIAHDEDENQVRYMVRSIIEIVDATIDAGIEAGIEFDADTYTLEGVVFFYAKGEKGDDGVGVVAVEQIATSHESSGINVVRVTLSNGVTSDFEVTNGEKVLPTYNNEVLTF